MRPTLRSVLWLLILAGSGGGLAWVLWGGSRDGFVGSGGSASAKDSATAKGWPQFRGANAAGVASGQNLPESWDVAAGTNIRWKAAIPGLGHASPIVAGDRVFVVTAVSAEESAGLRVGLYGDIASVPTEPSHTWQLICLAADTGQELWKRTMVERVPRIKRHTKATHANSTPATDSTHVVVLLGSEGLYCYDRDGNLLWNKDLGVLDSGYYVAPDAQWGFGSSPIIFEEMVIVQCDVQQDSFVAAFDVASGDELWRTPREDVPTWSTPTIFAGDKRTELALNGYKHAGGYDPWTGKELWRLAGGGDIPVPTPIVAHGLVILSSSHGRQRPLVAIREGAVGDITPIAQQGGQPHFAPKTPQNEPVPDGSAGDYIAWYLPRAGIYMQTPIVVGDYLYACADNGLLNCYDARTGKSVYRQRLGNGTTGFTASAVAADGKIYFTSEIGEIYTIEAGPEFKQLAVNVMEETCMATPAVADGMLIVRTQSHVVAIGLPRDRAID